MGHARRFFRAFAMIRVLSLRLAVAAVYFFTNVLALHAAEADFWSERRAAARKQAAKPSLTETLPSVGIDPSQADLTSEQYQVLAQLPRAANFNFGAITDVPITAGLGAEPTEKLTAREPPSGDRAPR